MNNLLDQPLRFFSQDGGNFWLPESASTTAIGVDITFNFILWVCIVFFVLNVALMLIFAFKYRRVEGKEAEHSAHHNTALEITWSVIPIFIVIYMFWLGFQGYMKLRVPPADAYEILVDGRKWTWDFTYQQPYYYVSTNELHVPVGRPVKLTMSSQDVIHSMFIPNFRVKQDVVPGRYTVLWFEANKVGEYHFFCAEYCGTDHSNMTGTVYVHEPAEFEKWLEDAANYIDRIDENDTPALVAAGEMLYKRKGCAQCHTLDGTLDDGPTYFNLFGHEVILSDGSTVTADENYIRESIVNPTAKIVKGFDPVMPKVVLKDKEITAIIEYIKTIK
jgi:cytochrome c oxidase subunit 2